MAHDVVFSEINYAKAKYEWVSHWACRIKGNLQNMVYVYVHKQPSFNQLANFIVGEFKIWAKITFCELAKCKTYT